MILDAKNFIKLKNFYLFKILLLDGLVGILSYYLTKYVLKLNDINHFNIGLIFLLIIIFSLNFLKSDKLKSLLNGFDLSIFTHVLTFIFAFNWILLAPMLQGGHKYFCTMGGVVPFSDGYNYFENLIKWPSNHFNVIGSWRALNGILDILVFYIGGKTLLGFLLVRAFLISLVFGNYAKVVSKMIGTQSALVQIIFLIYWILPYTNTTLTEINGLIISTAGFSLLIMSIIQQNFKNWIWAILIIGLANVSRPFSMILPFTLLITIYFFSQIKYKPRYILILLTFLIMLTVFFPSWIHKKIGAPGSELNGNTACVILAITRNSNWKETLIEFETKFSSLSNAERNKLMLHEAFVNFKQHPNTSLQALLKSTKSAYIGFFRNSFSLLIPIHIMDNFMLVFSSLTWIVLIIFSYKYWEQFKLIILLFWIGVFNFFFFAPVVYESGGWRIVASLMIPFTFLFTFLFIGLKLFLDRKKLNTIATYEQGMSEVNLTWIPKFVSILIFISILFMFTTRRYKIGNSDFNFYLNFVETKDQIGWKSFNEASISKEGFNNWLNFVDYCKVDCKPLINYFDVHFTQFDKIIWNKEGYLLIKKSDIYEDLLLPNDSIIHPWAPKFTIKEN